MRFGILGPVEIATDSGLVSIGQPRHRAILAYLLLNRHRLVTFDQVAEALWGGAEPITAKSQIHVGVSTLRGALRAAGIRDVITTRPGGYRVSVSEDDVDAEVFGHRVAAAARAAPAESARLLREGLRLWRGEALADISAAFVAPARQLLQQQRLHAVELLAEADLTLGQAESVIELLTELVEGHPLRERMVGQLMRALQQCGRGAEAMERYERLRLRLAQDYGTDPGRELQQLHLDLLRQDRPTATDAHRLGPHQDRPNATDAHRPVPRQLPAAIAGFCGRHQQLALLGKTTSGVIAIAGTAGVGKTALTLHWAHQIAHRFPDGQLYLNLRGYDRTGPPMASDEAVRSMLDALAVPVHQVPKGLDAQVGLLRSVLADRAVLIILDNARDADQVRPLLVGSAGCLVVVTSRDQLFGLVAVDGAYPLVLDLLSAEDARELLTTRLGAERITAEPTATDEIVSRCARLPLALAIISARAASYPDFSLNTLVIQLRDALDTLNGGDAATDIRAVFSWSYQTLSPPAARLFRLLGLHPGPDFSVAAAANLGGMPQRAVRQLLVDLTRANLAVEHTPGRFVVHDLLRAFAGELVETVDPQPVGRLLDYYLHTAFAADRHIQPDRLPITLTTVHSGLMLDPVNDHDQAMTWFAAERSVLIAAVGWAASNGFDMHAWQLAWTLENFLDRSGRWQDWADMQRIAIAATQRIGDRWAQAHTHRGLASALNRLERIAESHSYFRQSLKLSEAIDDRVGQTQCHRGIAYLYEQEHLRPEALQHSLLALELSQSLGDELTEARTLNGIGWLYGQLGDYVQAQVVCEQAIALLRGLGNRHALAHTLDTLGFVRYHLGDYAQAIELYGEAIDVFRGNGSQYSEAQVLVHKGEAHEATGDLTAMTQAWRAALAILEKLAHPSAPRLRARLQP